MLIVCEKPCVVEGWMGGWVDGWMGGKARLRIAYSNQKCSCNLLFLCRADTLSPMAVPVLDKDGLRIAYSNQK